MIFNNTIQDDLYRAAKERIRSGVSAGKAFNAVCVELGLGSGMNDAQAASALARKWMRERKTISREESERLVAAHIRKKGVTKCPPAFAAPTQNAAVEVPLAPVAALHPFAREDQYRNANRADWQRQQSARRAAVVRAEKGREEAKRSGARRFWTVERLTVLCQMMNDGKSREEIAHHFTTTPLAVKDAHYKAMTGVFTDFDWRQARRQVVA